MRLSVKIFLGICIPSIISIIIISAILIDKNHNANIENDTNKSIQDIKKVEENIKSVQGLNMNFDKLMKIISDYYEQKGISIIYYEDSNFKYSSNSEIAVNSTELIKVSDNNYLSTIDKIKNNYYLEISTRIDKNKVVVYVKNINSIYNSRAESIKLFIYITIVLIMAIAIIAYIISRTITKPLSELNSEMSKLSRGDYDIHLKENKTEIGIISKNFNTMSQEIKNRNDELVKLLDSKQIFIDNLSHEMNTPLTSILGYSELIEKANLSEEQKVKYLKYIQQETKRIIDMYKKLLLISYKKNSDLEKADININAIFEETHNMLKYLLSENKIELIMYSQIDRIYGDETLIIMCLSNLIKNAINVSNFESKIMVNAFSLNNKKYIQVIDQGPGISKENQEKITEPFYRVDKVRSRKNGGAGLGLSICKNIMEIHNGKLKIESELGRGSTFTMEFLK